MSKTILTVSDKALKAFEDFKLRRKHRFVLFKITEPEPESFELGVLKKGPRKMKSFNALVNKMPEDEACYLVYEHEITTDDGRKTSKLYLITWIPSACHVKQKMIYASQKSSLEGTFTGCIAIQAGKVKELITLFSNESESDSEFSDED